MGNCFELCCSRGYEPVPDAEESIARSQSALDTAAVLHEKGPNGYKTVRNSNDLKRLAKRFYVLIANISPIAGRSIDGK
jgi:hypothetical protein